MAIQIICTIQYHDYVSKMLTSIATW